MTTTTGWKKPSLAIPRNPIIPRYNARSSVPAQVENEEEDDTTDDYYNEDMHLLFSKTSPNSRTITNTTTPPLFPTSRQNFLIMTCFILLCLVVFLFVVRAGEFGRSGQGDTSGSSQELIVKFNVNCQYQNGDYAVIPNSLTAGLDFLERNIANITVIDGAVGATIVAEQLKHLLRSHESRLPQELRVYMKSNSDKAFRVSSKITEMVKKVSNNSERVKRTLPWVETPGLWDLPMNSPRWHPLGSLKAYEPREGEDFEDIWQIALKKEMINGPESDGCIYQIFHCDTSNITSSCQAKFLETEASKYSLTHQVIYMLLAQKRKCRDVNRVWSNVPSLQDGGQLFLEKLCGKVWQEANSFAEANFHPKTRDLFVEQIGMCSLAGYTEFLKPEWLRRIVSWQSTSASGCFEVKHNIRLKKKKTGSASRLKIRSDVLLEDDGENTKDKKCSVHFTAVGIAALSLHLRYMFDSCLTH